MFKEIFSRKIEKKPTTEILDIKAEEFYQKELAPLFRVFKEDNESQEACETRLFEELGQEVAHMQDLKGVLLSSPEQDLLTIKSLLMEKMRVTLKAYENKYSGQMSLDEKLFIKKAKIVLVASGDLSGINDYKERNNITNIGLSNVSSYFNASKSWNSTEDTRLNAEEVMALMNSDLAPALLEVDSAYSNKEVIKEVPDELLQSYIKNNKQELVNDAIDNQADPTGYSKETIDLLLANNYAFRIFKHLHYFEKNIDETSLKKAVQCYDPDYPYHLSDLASYINHANLSEDVKIELTDYIFKHQNYSGGTYEGLCNNGYINKNAQEKRLDPISDSIKEILNVKHLWDATPPEELSPENLAKIKSYIESGYIGLLTQYNNAEYVKYFFANDYEWLMGSLINNDQENLYFFTNEIKIEDRKKYLQKLADEGRRVELADIVQKSSTALISKDIYTDLVINGYNIPPSKSCDILDENVFVKILENNPSFLEDFNLFNNIEKFNLDNSSELTDYTSYQNLINFVDSNFITTNRDELYNAFGLNIKIVKQIGFEDAHAKLLFKANLLVEKLSLLYPDRSNQLDSFHSEFGFNYLELPDNELKEILDLAISLPYHGVRERDFGKECLEIMSPLSSEKRNEFLSSLNKMLIFTDEVDNDSSFVKYYLSKLKNTKVDIVRDFIKTMPDYNYFYSALNDEDKKFFREVFPWSETVASLDIEFKSSYLFSNMLANKVSEINFEKAEDGDIVCKYLNYFGVTDTPVLFKFVGSLIRSGNNLSSENIRALKDDFNIEVNIENYNQAEVLSAMSDFYKKNVLKFVEPDENGLGQSDVVNAIRNIKTVCVNGGLEETISENESRLALNFLSKYCLDVNNKNILPIIGRVIDKKYWQHNLLAYVYAAEEMGAIDEASKSESLNLFSGEYRDVCFENMSREWQGYLHGQNNEIPLDLSVLSDVIQDAGGAGNLKYIESFSDLISAVNKSFGEVKTVGRTKAEIKHFLLSAEDKITKDKLSQDERVQFYNLTKDMIEAAPSLLASLETVFDKASSKDVKTILKELMPLYQLELIIVQKNDGSDNISYDPRELVTVRKSLSTIADDLNSNPENSLEIFNKEKKRLGNFVKNGFKDRFGLIKIPAEFSKDNMRSIQNCLRYVANISGRNLERETLISFYLGLQLNGDWEKFRQGADIDVNKYLSSDKADIIKTMLKDKKDNKLPVDIVGLNPDKIDSFQEVLQRDVVTNMIGSVETIDVKLGNINRNVQELIDPDAYDNKKDKDIINLLSGNGRLVGMVLAKTYKNLPLNSDEIILQKNIAEIFSVKDWDGEVVKKIQDEISPFSLITNMVNKLFEEGVTKNIEELQKILAPSEDIINIFNGMDENFKTNSGALALSRDLEYLEELIVKNDSKLSAGDKEKVTIYLDSIRQQMKGLESSFQKVKEYFDKVKKSSHLISNELMKDRLAEVEKIIYSTDNNAMIISQLTSNLDLIIENMRQCLGCMRKEANNDTNLAFGDYNKFFLMSQKEKGRGSIADEIVFFMPITDSGGRQEMSFIMDNIYGNKSSDILLAHVVTVYKKYSALKKNSKNANISISVSAAALSSVGLNEETFKNKIKEKISELEIIEYVKDVQVNIPKSSFGDNYIEFSSKGARGTGEANFSAVILK